MENDMNFYSSNSHPNDTNISARISIRMTNYSNINCAHFLKVGKQNMTYKAPPTWISIE